MSGEKISVIIPCYNVKDMVSECLDSIVAQTIGLEHLEIILIDDASADETVSVLKKYEEKYPDNIMLVLCEKNGRQGTARNIGLSYATPSAYLTLAQSINDLRYNLVVHDSLSICEFNNFSFLLHE